jgi:hypothetical protein
LERTPQSFRLLNRPLCEQKIILFPSRLMRIICAEAAQREERIRVRTVSERLMIEGLKYVDAVWGVDVVLMEAAVTEVKTKVELGKNATFGCAKNGARGPTDRFRKPG